MTDAELKALQDKFRGKDFISTKFLSKGDL